MTTERFKADLVRGKRGEAFLVDHIPALDWPPPGERKYDLFDTGDHRTVEVKTDSYALTDSPNFFMEQRTRVAGQAGMLLGGPWRAAADGVDTFAYLYYSPTRDPERGTCYWFDDVPALVEHLDKHLGEYQTRRVRYGVLTAVGVLVPRKSLRHLARKVTYGPESEAA